MNPFECLNEACKNLIKYKGLQIIVESIHGEVDSFNLLGGWNLGISNVPIKQIMNYNVTIRLNHNTTIDFIFLEDDFNPTKPWSIESDIKLGNLSEDDKQVARFMYFFWELSKYIKTPRADTGPLAEFIFTRIRTIRQTL